MAKNKSSNANQKAHYQRYKAEERHAKNKIAKLERYVEQSPNDEQAKLALEKLLEEGVPYTRNRRAIKPNSTTQIRIRRSEGFSQNRNTFYDEIRPRVPEYAIKKK